MLDYSELKKNFIERIELLNVELEIQEQHIRGLMLSKQSEDNAFDSTTSTVTVTQSSTNGDDPKTISNDISKKFNVLKVLMNELRSEYLIIDNVFRENIKKIIEKFEKLIGMGKSPPEKSYKGIINHINELVNKGTIEMPYKSEFIKYTESFVSRNIKFVANLKTKIDNDSPPSENELKEGISVPYDALVLFMKHPENDKVVNKILPIKAMNNFSLTDIISDKMYEIETGLDYLVNEDKKDWGDMIKHRNVISVDDNVVTGEDDDAEKTPGKMKSQVLYVADFPKKEKPTK